MFFLGEIKDLVCAIRHLGREIKRAPEYISQEFGAGSELEIYVRVHHQYRDAI